MKAQVLDCDYTMLNGKPLIRLFCKDESGGTVCFFYENFLPYFYVQSENIETAKKEIEKTAKAEVVEKFLPIGYGPKVKLLKVIGKDPSKIPDIKETISKVSGISKFFESDILFKYRFMVDNNIKGMGWIDVDCSRTITKTVKCPAYTAKSFKPIEVIKNAPLRYMSIDIECVSKTETIPDMNKDPIVIISLNFFPDYKGAKSMVMVAKTSPKFIENQFNFVSEEEMMKRFLEILEDYDPDVVTGYNINNFDLPYIITRLEKLNIRKDLGRADKPVMLKKMQMGYTASVLGRVIVDTYEIIKKDVYLHLKRYDLGTVARSLLKMEKIDIGGIKEITRYWKGDPKAMGPLIQYANVDAELAMRLLIDKGILDKFFEISKLSGLTLQDSLGGQSQRLECRLLHEFRDRDFVMPSKTSGPELEALKEKREKYGLKGALVLEPVVGLHTDGSILVLDFTSLYPSIIRKFNICPTTMLVSGDEKCNVSPTGTKFVLPEVRQGILPKIVHDLISTRAAVRKQYRAETDPEKKRILDAKQFALKVLANSLYGYTGYLKARLYVMDIANTITGYGRDTIVNTTKLIEQTYSTKVIYSDTDSVFVKTGITNLEKAQEKGEEMSRFVTEKLNGLELKFEKIFKSFLILTKKRYAGWYFEKQGNDWKTKVDMKGIETVRRDWCELTSESMEKTIDILLKEQDIKKAAHFIRGIIQDLNDGKIPLEKLTIVKGVSKSLSSYDGIQPHVELAKKIMMRDPTRGSLVGERLGFVIIKGNQMLSKRAEEPSFVKEHNLEIDSQYYLENQLLPPLQRIFEACGVEKTELIEGNRQKNLTEILSGRILTPAQTVLDTWDSISCSKCSWNYRRPPLSGSCPNCNSQIFFRSNGSIGKFVTNFFIIDQQKTAL
ncbi:MAG: hypothetical protein HY362_01310 [Candidatus Aenigmarchaeota archaeon]|nr:hypothetical protein [Candidatus Aenigmarchaeota archaeon]